MSEPILRIKSLSFAYPDGRRAVSDVSLELNEGEKVARVGLNGAGESTLFLQLNGLLKGNGSVQVAGVHVDDKTVRTVRRQVGLVFQDPDDQLFSPTVFEDVTFGPLHADLPEGEVLARVARALAAVGMTGHENHSRITSAWGSASASRSPRCCRWTRRFRRSTSRWQGWTRGRGAT